jgi:hypothetical protein
MMPSVFIYVDGSYSFYDTGSSLRQVLHFINKIINPVVTLTTDAEISQFLALENEFEEKTKFFEKKPVLLGEAYNERKAKTRVIAFVFDKADFNDELKNLRFAGKVSAKREELRIGIVTDKKLIKKYKA